MYYPYLIIIFGILIGLIIIIIIEKIIPEPQFNQSREFKGIKFKWLCGKNLPKDEVPHWQCKQGECTICILPPSGYGARWRVLKERGEETIGYQEIEEELKAFDLAVQWARES